MYDAGKRKPAASEATKGGGLRPGRPDFTPKRRV